MIIRRYFLAARQRDDDSGVPLPPLRNLLSSYGESTRQFPFQVSAMVVASAFDRQTIELRSRDPAR